MAKLNENEQVKHVEEQQAIGMSVLESYYGGKNDKEKAIQKHFSNIIMSLKSMYNFEKYSLELKQEIELQKKKLDHYKREYTTYSKAKEVILGKSKKID